eukprot:TRINITY_DN4042_c0_g1_i2.p1 TRINITY_DN4042_c0_g1~~TRINITY_DN4042_c0_g1_i2.p1  ORF type:complete len:130 (-),score=17.79 TRINITY_DN4042_c0_g1_i2:10-399(-)
MRDLPAFAQEIRNCLKNPDLDCKDLVDFLILPVQRIPRYVMLLQDLRKYTPSSHPDFTPLQEALVKMKEFATNINQMKRAYERVAYLKDHISGTKDLEAVGRVLLHEGELRSKRSDRSEHILLFNILIL